MVVKRKAICGLVCMIFSRTAFIKVSGRTWSVARYESGWHKNGCCDMGMYSVGPASQRATPGHIAGTPMTVIHLSESSPH